MAIKLPRTGTGIMLRDLSEAIYPSRIESWDRHRITVVKPMGVPAAYPYPPGTPFDVLWTSPTGQHVLPAELTITRAEGPVRLWELTPVAEPWVEQRREFVRVPAFGRVTLAATAPTEPTGDVTPANDEPLAGYLVDVSEAAMQCSMWAEADDSLLIPGTMVSTEFTAHGTPFTRRGVVYGARPGAEDNEMTVVVQFDQTPTEAKDLRKEVFAAQVDLRQLYRRQSQL